MEQSDYQLFLITQDDLSWLEQELQYNDQWEWRGCISHCWQRTIFTKRNSKPACGYVIEDVDGYLDQIIKDYEGFEREIERLKKENEALKQAPAQPVKREERRVEQAEPQVSSSSNYDMLRRISNLEKAVFGRPHQDWRIKKTFLSDQKCLFISFFWKNRHLNENGVKITNNTYYKGWWTMLQVMTAFVPQPPRRRFCKQTSEYDDEWNGCTL